MTQTDRDIMSMAAAADRRQDEERAQLAAALAEAQAQVEWNHKYEAEVIAHAETKAEQEGIEPELRAEVERLKSALLEIRDVDGQELHEMLSESGRGEAMGRAHCSEISRMAMEAGK